MANPEISLDAFWLTAARRVKETNLWVVDLQLGK